MARDRERPAETAEPERNGGERSLLGLLGAIAEGVTGELGERLVKLAREAGGLSFSLGRSLLASPQDPRLAAQAGAYLRELRELAGLTLDDLSDAIRLEDHTILQRVENGTATLSFELILRLAALLARHDPVPFIIRFTRSYNPELWQVLEAWGVGRLPAHFEREREFINIYRRHDAARKLSDASFARVLDFTRAAFETALHFSSGSSESSEAAASSPSDPAAVGDSDDEQA
jgi:transcriptional regulator with XRE-family HTH domain